MTYLKLGSYSSHGEKLAFCQIFFFFYLKKGIIVSRGMKYKLSILKESNGNLDFVGISMKFDNFDICRYYAFIHVRAFCFI